MSTTEEIDLNRFLSQCQKVDHQTFRPILMDLAKTDPENSIKKLVDDRLSALTYRDLVPVQLREYVKFKNPKTSFNESELKSKAAAFLEEKGGDRYGTLVYYPWNKNLLRILPEEEFVAVRTARNQHKITAEEQRRLADKTLGVIGLSVGQSAAVTMAIERIFGTIRIADFDHLELSNLNRIRSGLHNLELSKTRMVAREIAEIDPYLKVELYDQGITEENIADFIGEGEEQMDLLIEECDELPVKLLARLKAREKKIPVVMDTSDRGMLDVERFDLEPGRKIFHGIVEDDLYHQLDQIPEGKKIGLLFQLVGGHQISDRLKASFLELGQTITSWPQLSSSVTLGGSLVTNTVRRILLGRQVNSGRFYVDIDQLIPAEVGETFKPEEIEELKFEELKNIAQSKSQSSEKIDPELLEKWATAASKAPSSGNDQPWKIIAHNSDVFFFHELSRSYSFGDHNNIAAYQSIGSAVENFLISARSDGYEGQVEYFPYKKDHPRLVARLRLESTGHTKDVDLLEQIPLRLTNRKIAPRVELSPEKYREVAADLQGYEDVDLRWATDEVKRKELGRIISMCDKIRVMHPWGHYDFFHREMRWTPEEVEQKRNGIDIRTLEIDPQQMAAIGVLKEPSVVQVLKDIGGGDGFNNISQEAAESASGFGLFSVPEDAGDEGVARAGQAWERLWLRATRMKLSIHSLIAPVYLFEILNDPQQNKLEKRDVETLKHLQNEFYELWDMPRSMKPVFLFRMFQTDYTPLYSNRLKLQHIYRLA